ncbi:MAG: hypothetical protein K2Y37_26655 [Pirellulales bacterium]|nr:hypothetical protein [Pirellulales bacterium]
MSQVFVESYAEQLARVSTALAAADSSAVLANITNDSRLGDVQRFVDNAVGERFRLITEELEFVALAFDDFDEFVKRYLRETPRQTYSLDTSDQERFVAWLRNNGALDTKQRDFVAHQQSEYGCLAKARENRSAHVAFQQLLALSKLAMEQGRSEPNQTLQVNPIHVWSRLTIAGGDDSLDGENTVFVAVGQQVRSLWLTADQIDAVRDLMQNKRVVLSDWTARHPQVKDPEQLSQKLIEGGLVALGPTTE